MEASGLPTVVIATTEFTALAQAAAQALGLPEARILTVPHPVGGLGEDLLLRRAEDAVEGLVALLTNEPRTNGAP